MFRKSAVLVFVLAALATAQAQQKKRVAVMNFDYATVRSQVASIWGTDQDVGKGITDLLVDKLVADGTYRVIERAALDKILAEQNFSNSDRADANTAAKIARILGVDTIIIGSITQRPAATTRPPTSAAGRWAASRGASASVACARASPTPWSRSPPG